MGEEFSCDHSGNVVYCSGALNIFNSKFVLAEIYKLIRICKYQDITLDFSKLTRASADGIIPVCIDIEKWRKQLEIEIDVVLPRSLTLNRLFFNTNWAHLLDSKFEESNFSGYSQHPTVRVTNDDDLSTVMKEILECIMMATRIESYESFAVVEWSINEIIENILRHSESPFGGLVHMSKFEKTRQIVEVVIADGGIGIPQSLRVKDEYKALSDAALIYKATQEGVTNGKGQGNGLFGAISASKLSGGYCKIISSYGSLMAFCDKRGLINSTSTTIPFNGSLVCMALNYSNPKILENALKFTDGIHKPVSAFFDTRYSSDSHCININNEVSSCSTRNSGEKIRNKIDNLIRVGEAKFITLEFDGKQTITSSFADELFGKLIQIIGIESFYKKIKIVNLSTTSQFIMERALAIRIKQKDQLEGVQTKMMEIVDELAH
ncbi:hypothetical protein SDC9_16773 [bioreactor metagenome]|uniref:DUF4325 domain-containing protein n=1 Tax=bioreactor metagenome TaxID=1076179 RepID=A0A644TVI7_9ZZZZ|nr:DUF4325 domain-containing protein [Desulfovibrio desulfuricans]MEA4990598.1 DUF4325 domain-containing protein [Desulfovibrio desulfuricans]